VRFDSPGGALRNSVIFAPVRGRDYSIDLTEVNRLVLVQTAGCQCRLA
jgi:hypothetical protein